jgi:hypothetical protein
LQSGFIAISGVFGCRKCTKTEVFCRSYVCTTATPVRNPEGVVIFRQSLGKEAEPEKEALPG